jgi:SpoVK/Ycf46/Vps4 family AAA+-type ATPase
VLPRHKTLTALEEAQYEEDADEFEKHLMLQCESGLLHHTTRSRLTVASALDKLRTFRPRVLVTGPRGMGQAHLGPAVLHHLEGFHVQSFDLGTLLGDSARVRWLLIWYQNVSS